MRQSRWNLVGRSGAALAIVLAALLAVLTPATTQAADWSPPDAVFFSETGHQVAEPFLSFWRDNGRYALIGLPISEQIKANGSTVQYFEKARLELQGDAVIRAAIGAEYLAQRGISVTARPSQPRLLRGDDFDELLTTTPFSRLYSAPVPDDATHKFFPESGHSVGMGFKQFFDEGGVTRFGLPLSEEFSEVSPVDGKVYTTQYFERARFEYHPGGGESNGVVMSPLGQTLAAIYKVPTTAVAQGNAPTYEEALFTPPAPTAKRPAGAPGGARLIDVNLSAQYLTAFEGSTVVYEGYISSGLSPNVTPVGTFSIFSKLVSDDMRGADPNLPGGSYFQPAVPYVMYFAGGGYAIHGVYWHSSFGTPRSHGCVGLPVGSASFLYNWAPIGTTVYIHY